MNENVVDLRPDRFLRAMRETGCWADAAKAAGMSTEEVEQTCAENPKFELSAIECQLEFIDEQLIRTCEKEIEKLWRNKNLKMIRLRETAHAQFRDRHPELAEGSA